MSKLTNLIIILVQYPLLFINEKTLKDDYLKLINPFVNKINNKIEIGILKEELSLEIEYFLAMHKVTFKQNEINYFTFLLQYISYVEEISKNNNKLYSEIDIFDLVLLNQTNSLDTKMSNAQVYGNDLNRELDRITLDVSILLNTIKGLKEKLNIEEIKTELLTVEKGGLEKKLAKEKRKTKKLSK